jgi:ABC-type glycerol-3-phosphate transport system substrate-binding protein
MKKSGIVCLVMTTAVITLTSCSRGEGGEQPERAGEITKNDPVTISIGNLRAGMTDEEFDTLITEPVRSKYPHITIQKQAATAIDKIEQAITADLVPDIFLVYNGSMPSLRRYDLLYDMEPMLKKISVDTALFDPILIESLKAMSPKGELYGLPYTRQFNALYYNKDVFDRFGAAYPKDGMTWEDAMELSRKVTRSEGGVDYKGLEISRLLLPAFPLSLNIINVKSNRAEVNNEQWKRVFELVNKIYALPGNSLAAGSTLDHFVKNQNVAMYAGTNLFGRLQEAFQSGNGINNWDVAQYPSFPEKPNVYGMVDMHVAMITKQSKNKDQAMQVVHTIISNSVQLNAAKKLARQSPLIAAEMKRQFGAELTSAKGKRIPSIFLSNSAASPVFSEYEGEADLLLQQRLKDVLDGKSDINTALRSAEEAINQMIDQKK